jgi:UDP-N-acetyl-D-mannosaminuronic acid dehydrogenase
MKVTVIGLGYIGLPTAAVIASRGINVVGIDINKHVVDTVNKGEIHIVEPELDMLVHASVISGKLRADTKIDKSDVFIISVPTPLKNNNEPDLSHIEAAVNELSKVLECGNIIILESTSPVGTTEKISEWIADLRKDLSTPTRGDKCISDIAIAYCPERVLPGHIIRELVENDRVIGGLTEHCSARAKRVYEIFVEGDCIDTDVRTAEMCKLTENAFRDVNIAYANELSKICDELDINTWDLISLANRHPKY